MSAYGAPTELNRRPKTCRKLPWTAFDAGKASVMQKQFSIPAIHHFSGFSDEPKCMAAFIGTLPFRTCQGLKAGKDEAEGEVAR